MAVCLFVCPLAYLKNHNFKVHKIKIFITCYPWPWLDHSLSAVQYVMYFGFVDDVIFSHNIANGPESNTTRMFRPVRQVAAQWAKSAVSVCLLSLILSKITHY